MKVSSEMVAFEIANVAALRLVTKTNNKVAYTAGYYVAGDGGDAEYWYDASDTTSADNGFTVIVAADGGRWKLKRTCGSYSVKQAGAKGDGVTDDTTAIQTAITYTTGSLCIPPASYKVSSLSITNKNSGTSGSYKIEATGAIFIGDGTGSVVVDSCKRLNIIGLGMPTHDLVWRGQWSGKYHNVHFQRLIINDAAGSIFSSNYWTKFHGCEFQSVIVSAASTTNTNAITFDGCTLRGNVGQGFISARNYAIELYGNQDVQDWEFINCDLSYFTIDLIYIDAANTAEVELHFPGCYFDTGFPKTINRAKTRITTDRAHASVTLPSSCNLASTTKGSQSAYRNDRAAGFSGKNSANLIPNGDFRVRLPAYNGAGLPLGTAGGATVTDQAGGLFGTSLRINQATAGVVRFRSSTLQFDGGYSCVVVARLHSAGTQTLRMAFNSLFENVVMTGEWGVFTLSAPTVSAGGSVDIQLFSDTAAPFDVDVAYVSITYGSAGDIFVPCPPRAEIQYSTTYNPPSIAVGASVLTTYSVPGAVLGDLVIVSHSQSLLGGIVTGYVSAADTVAVVFGNLTAGAIDIASGTLMIRVLKNSF